MKKMKWVSSLLLASAMILPVTVQAEEPKTAY